MKKIVVLSAAAVMALAGSALAQNGAQLQLRFVPETGGFGAASPITAWPTTATAAINGPVAFNTTTFRTIRLRLDYRVVDTNPGDAIVTAGLVAGNLNITSAATGTVAPGNTTVGPSAITGRENGQTSNPNPTATGTGTSSNNWVGNDTTAASTRTGLAGTFRGGFTDPNNNAEASNGVVTGLSILSIVPTAISQHHQDEAGFDDGSGGAAYPLAGGAPGAGQQTEWYTLYVLTVAAATASNGTLTLTAAFQPDVGTGNAFGYFITSTNVPQTSTNAQSASITINIPGVPAPGSVALLGMGGLLAARRRRA